jgi:energy-coupling factor transporter ATP-binding protein EcfA2
MDRKKFPSPPIDRRRKSAQARPAVPLSTAMTEMMIKQVQELRASLLAYRVIANRLSTSLDYDVLPNHINLLLFGPSGSGKSSLIRTFYLALHNISQLPSDVSQKIVVKGTDRNEGTTRFSSIVLKPESQERPEKGERPTSGVLVHDTRGQIWMDSKEAAQLGMVLLGKVKDMSLVEQRNHRYAYMLWEFWRKDHELFPEEILKSRSGLGEKPHCLLFVFDGSLEEIPNGPEEVQFYRDIFQLARDRGYFYPQVVLTRVDKVEEIVDRSSEEGEQRMRELLDLKIESVVMKLGIPRSSVHFIENYHEGSRRQDLEVDFHALRLLHEAVQQSDSYLQSQLREKKSCELQ